MDRQTSFDEGIKFLESRDRAFAAGEIEEDPRFLRPEIDGWDNEAWADEREHPEKPLMEKLNEQSLKNIAYGDTFYSPMYEAVVRFKQWDNEGSNYCTVMTTDNGTDLPDLVHKAQMERWAQMEGPAQKQEQAQTRGMRR